MLVATRLRGVPLFAEMPEPYLDALAEAGRRVSLGAGQLLFRAGDAADSLYVVLDGQLRVYSEYPGAEFVDLTLVDPGGYVGELAVLDRGRRSANVSAVVATELFELDRTTFLALLQRAPSVLDGVLGNLTQAVRATTERAARKEAEQRTLKAQMELDRYRSLAQMVAGVAHEVNTPLGTINTAASIIVSRLALDAVVELTRDRSVRPAIDDIRDAARLLMANVTRAHALIQGFKKLSVSQVVDRREAVRIVDVVREVVELFSLNARRSGVAIEVRDNLPPEHPGEWLGYRGSLSQVLLNALTNVERYAYPHHTGGNVQISVAAASRATSPGYAISVRDFGRGIPATDLTKVFEPFFTTGRGQGGTGLGLAIVRAIVVEALGGTVECVSEWGAGTTLQLWIPERAPELPEERLETSEEVST